MHSPAAAYVGEREDAAQAGDEHGARRAERRQHRDAEAAVRVQQSRVLAALERRVLSSISSISDLMIR